MSKKNKVTFNMIAAEMQMKPVVHSLPLFEGSDIVLSVRHTLPFKDAIEFIQDVVTACVQIEESDYSPEARDVMFRIAVLTHYAGVDFPKEMAKAYAVAYETDLFEKVMKLINSGQVMALERAIDEHINYIRDLFVSASAHQIDMLVQKMQDVVDSGNEIMTHVNSEEFRATLDSLASIPDVAEVVAPIREVEADADNVVHITKNGANEGAIVKF